MYSNLEIQVRGYVCSRLKYVTLWSWKGKGKGKSFYVIWQDAIFTFCRVTLDVVTSCVTDFTKLYHIAHHLRTTSAERSLPTNPSGIAPGKYNYRVHRNKTPQATKKTEKKNTGRGVIFRFF